MRIPGQQNNNLHLLHHCERRDHNGATMRGRFSFHSANFGVRYSNSNAAISIINSLFDVTDNDLMILQIAITLNDYEAVDIKLHLDKI